MADSINQRLENLEYLMKTHQHAGFDTTPTLRYQDFQQLARMELTAASTSLSITIPVKQYLRVIIISGAKSGASDDYLRFNADAGANYTFLNSGASAQTSANQIDIRDGANLATGFMAVIDIGNYPASIVKSVVTHVVNKPTSAATAQTFYQTFGTWVNTSLPITTVALTSSGAATYPANALMVIYSSKE